MTDPLDHPANGGSVPHAKTLYCPVCGHASPSDGDWRVRRCRGYCRLRCPDCSEEIASRPTTPTVPAIRPRPRVRTTVATTRFFVTTAKLWGATAASGATVASSFARRDDVDRGDWW